MTRLTYWSRWSRYRDSESGLANLWNILKNQLKTLKSKGKQDYDIVIDLVTDVNNIVLRLKALDSYCMLIVTAC